MRVRLGGKWIADRKDILLLVEPGHYPMAYFRDTDVSAPTLQRTEHITRHPACWFTAGAGRVRLAGHGGFLRGRRTDTGPCGR
jgi:uncharacterized protein (DUF427 family)